MHKRPILLAAVFVAACATQTPVAPTTTQAVTNPPHLAHALLVDAASCWLGGMWGDVQGETPSERALSSHERCMTVVAKVFPRDGSHDRYVKLRAFEPETLSEVRDAIANMASAEPTEAHRKDAYVRMFDAFANAEHETMLARRAAHRIIRDSEREAERLSASEAAALPEIEATNAFVALTHVDAGDLQDEARVLSLLVVLDRMQVAEQLPVHLKPYALAVPLQVVFGTPAPDLPHDASKPLARGGWLNYLKTAAASAGHPVNEALSTPIARHEAAVAGILEGVADHLRREVANVSSDTPLARVVELTIRALEQSRDRALPT